jgi:hypothetical protein
MDLDLADILLYQKESRQPHSSDDDKGFADKSVNEWLGDQPSASWQRGAIDQTAPVSTLLSSNISTKGRW